MRGRRDLWPAWREVDQGGRLQVFADAYGLTQAEREALTNVGAKHAERAWWRMRGATEHLGGGWARMWAAGVGDAIARRGTWSSQHAEELTHALLD